MKTHMLIAFLALMGAIALGMFVTRKARHHLSPEKKLELIESLSRVRMLAIIPAVVFVLITYFKPGLGWMVWSFTACIASIYGAKWFVIRRAAVPEAYLGAVAAELQIVIVGLLLFIASGLWPTWHT